MTLRLCLSVAGTLVFAFSSSSHAQVAAMTPPSTVQELYYQCKSENTYDIVGCTSFLRGISGMMAINGILVQDLDEHDGSLDPKLYSITLCPADNNGGIQRQIFVNWAEKNPTQWTSDAAIGAWTALHQAWPCSKP